MHMSSLKSFVILDEHDEENFDEASDLALMLDLIDSLSMVISSIVRSTLSSGRHFLEGRRRRH